MPKLYEYFGLIVLFHSNEHSPVHVHGLYQDRECRAELVLRNGAVVQIRYTPVRGRRPLGARRLRDFRRVVEHYRDDIVHKWIDYFVLHKAVAPEVIARKLP